MNNIQGLNVEEIREVASKDDFKIAPYYSDGETYGTLTWIWSVSVENRLFVRAYSGVSGRWYQSALAQKAGKITGAGLEKNVRFQSVKDDELNDKIDQAYREKYHNSSYLNSMMSSRAKAATIEVI
ncbi:DUF2255 family protein [Fulvivirga ligni]|uniref:DUF2255 family protein n=1 Tax=Fulvivirga ligni TaxID=2904246 RepID=UPI001F241E64|nr:DUF2255 family protein [Fulvivirga ligni]UII24044.1 DUF2255 family protein [Fulvivirga ligni]